MDSFNIDTSCDDIVGVLLVGLGRIVGVAGLWIELSNYQGGCSPQDRGEKPLTLITETPNIIKRNDG